MPTKLELRDLASLRLEESNALFAAGRYDGCVYLCGYLVEMALKAAIRQKLAVDRDKAREWLDAIEDPLTNIQPNSGVAPDGSFAMSSAELCLFGS